MSGSSSLGFDPSVDYYAVLGIRSSASVDEVKSAYRKLARENHPDSTGGDRAKEERFKAISQAYEVIGDANQRRKYDDLREVARSPIGGLGGMGGGAMGGESPLDVMFDLGDMISQMFSAHGVRPPWSSGAKGAAAPRSATSRNRSEPGPGSSASSTPPPSPSPSPSSSPVAGVTGGKKAATSRRRRSPGVGKSAGGSTARSASSGPDPGQGADPGPASASTAGGVDPGPGPDHARGVVAAIDGTPLRIEGVDLLSEVRLPFDRAIVGGPIGVPTIDSVVEVVVPPGTSSGRRLRLRGRGLPVSGVTAWGARGDQYVTIHVDVPGDLDPEELGALGHLVDLLESRIWRRG